MKSTRLSLEEILAIGDLVGWEEGAPGGSGEGTEDDDGDGGADTDSDSDSDDGGSSDDDGELTPEQLKRKLKNAREAEGRLGKKVRDLEAAKRELDELRSKEEERARKEKPELDNLKADVEKLTRLRDAQAERIRSLALENAFLSVSDVAWHDPDDALQLVSKSLQDAEVDENGEVKDRSVIVKAARDLAKSKPWLTKKQDEDGAGKTGGRPTGGPPAGSGKGSGKGGSSDDDIRRKYHIVR